MMQIRAGMLSEADDEEDHSDGQEDYEQNDVLHHSGLLCADAAVAELAFCRMVSLEASAIRANRNSWVICARNA